MSAPCVDPCFPVQSACRGQTQTHIPRDHFDNGLMSSMAKQSWVIPNTQRSATQLNHEGRQAVANPVPAMQAENTRAIPLNTSKPALRPFTPQRGGIKVGKVVWEDAQDLMGHGGQGQVWGVQMISV